MDIVAYQHQKGVAMTVDEYREALRTLDYTQEGFAEMLGAGRRTGQYWATKAVPPAVAVIVRLMLARPELRDVVEGLSPGSAKKIDTHQPPT